MYLVYVSVLSCVCSIEPRDLGMTMKPILANGASGNPSQRFTFSTFSYVRASFQILLNESLSSKSYTQIPHYDDVEIVFWVQICSNWTKKKSYLCKYSPSLPMKLGIEITWWQHGHSITRAARCPVCWAKLSIATFLAPIPWRISKASR